MRNKNLILALLATSVIALSTASLANGDVGSDKGLYVNGDLGYGKVDKKTKDLSTDNDGIVYSAGGGYQFNNYFAMEGGYTHFPNIKIGRTVINDTQVYLAGSTLEKSNTEVYADGKATLPLKHGFNVFAKGGAAWVSTTYVPVEDGGDNSLAGTHSKILPYGGLGAGYSISQNVTLNMQFVGTPKSDAIPAMYALMGGITYKF